MNNLKIMAIPAYIAIITAILTVTISHELSIGLYVFAILISIFLLINYTGQPSKYYVVFPVLIYAIIEIFNILFVPELLNNYYDKFYLLILSVTVSYFTYRKNQKGFKKFWIELRHCTTINQWRNYHEHKK